MLIISPATVADLENLLDLENLSFSSDMMTRRQYRYHLRKNNDLLVKMEYEGLLVGSMLMLKRKNSKNLRVYSIAISPRARQHGYARRLLDQAEKIAAELHCRQVTLEVCEKNLAALQLYRSAGFVVHGRKKAYYEDGCTALLMRKFIDGESLPL